MPLINKTGKKARKENIEREIESGKSPKQAVAIAYSKEREIKKKQRQRKKK